MAARPHVVIVSPALADANNGNWQTAQRWARLLAGHYRSSIVAQWRPGEHTDAVALLALHARRSADSVAAWAQAHPRRGLAVVLTGTDLYRDIQTDASAQRSLALAQQLVVLQPLGMQALPQALHDKTRVIFQSTSTRRALNKTTRHLRVVMVGHLREEKSPQTLMQAADLLRHRADIRIDHIGDALDLALAHLARQTMAIQRAHLLLHTSRMEGGAHVLMEAICSGTPVLASRIDGNLGLLGEDYAGIFEVGDAQGLADLLLACHPRQSNHSLVAHLHHQCALRASLFEPQAERAALHRWVQDLWKM